MQQSSPATLSDALSGAAGLSNSFLIAAGGRVSFEHILRGSALGGRAEEFRDRSVLVRTRDQLATALALLELDGVARRLVICPTDVPAEQLPAILHLGEVDMIVSDRPTNGTLPNITCSAELIPADNHRSAAGPTEWVLLTSGTTGVPKLIVHTLATLVAPIISGTRTASPTVWSTFYDIRRYGGLQIFLRSVLTGTSLVLSEVQESTADFLNRAGAHGVTHISGTPSHWRRALMSPAAGRIAPRYVRLSGEIVDQAILNQLQNCYPQAKVVHAFASTEAGVAFEASDGLAGFPAHFIGGPGDVQMKVEGGSLRIKSPRAAHSYLGRDAGPLSATNGFIDTGDMLELRNGRYYFAGRRDGVINIGGAKVHPEEVEAVINRHPEVRMSLVRTRKSPITGAIVVADVVLKSESEPIGQKSRDLQTDILLLCRNALAPYKVPAAIKFVLFLPVAETGKLIRQHA